MYSFQFLWFPHPWHFSIFHLLPFLQNLLAHNLQTDKIDLDNHLNSLLPHRVLEKLLMCGGLSLELPLEDDDDGVLGIVGDGEGVVSSSFVPKVFLRHLATSIWIFNKTFYCYSRKLWLSNSSCHLLVKDYDFSYELHNLFPRVVPSSKYYFSYLEQNKHLQ